LESVGKTQTTVFLSDWGSALTPGGLQRINSWFRKRRRQALDSAFGIKRRMDRWNKNSFYRSFFLGEIFFLLIF